MPLQGKLVRDLVPERVRADGGEIEIRVLSTAEYALALREKLREEAGEVGAASGRDEVLEELADVLEVVSAIAASEGLTMADVEQRALEKARTHGRFDRRIQSTRYRPPQPADDPAGAEQELS